LAAPTRSGRREGRSAQPAGPSGRQFRLARASPHSLSKRAGDGVLRVEAWRLAQHPPAAFLQLRLRLYAFTAVAGGPQRTRRAGKLPVISTIAFATSISLRPVCRELSRSSSNACCSSITWRSIRIPLARSITAPAEGALEAVKLGEAPKDEVQRTLKVLRVPVGDVGEDPTFGRLVDEPRALASSTAITGHAAS
jgi:hypothetical protein